jgi:surface protein
MFNGCNELKSLDLSNFITTSVTDVINMFNNCTSLVVLDISNFDFTKIDTEENSANLFDQLNNLKYLNIKNVNEGEYSFPNSPLNSISNLRVCQSKSLITNTEAINICCDFDITTSDCKSSQDDDENYIIVHFSSECSYGDGGFVGSTTGNIRDTYVKNIVIGGTTYEKNGALNIPANTDVIIHFSSNPTSLEGFFNKNKD